MDPTDVKQFAFKVWSYRQGAVVSQMIHLGHRLGLFAALAGDSSTPDELAMRTGTDARYVQEWLRCMAAADLLDHHQGRFHVSEAGLAVLADSEGSPVFAAAAFIPIDLREQEERLLAVFKAGGGFDYDAAGPEMIDQLEAMNRPWADHLLPTVVIDGFDGLRRRLEDGIDLVDVGCGSGLAVRALAESFPHSRFLGLDPAHHAVERAEVVVAGLENARVVVGTAHDLEPGSADVVTAFDCLHDMTRPDQALGDIRQAVTDDGLVVVKEIKTAPEFEQQRRNPMLAMMYGLSIISCLPSGLSAEDGWGLGNQGLPAERLEALALAAGFRRCEVKDLGDPVNLYYELRP